MHRTTGAWADGTALVHRRHDIHRSGDAQTVKRAYDHMSEPTSRMIPMSTKLAGCYQARGASRPATFAFVIAAILSSSAYSQDCHPQNAACQADRRVNELLQPYYQDQQRDQQREYEEQHRQEMEAIEKINKANRQIQRNNNSGSGSGISG